MSSDLSRRHNNSGVLLNGEKDSVFLPPTRHIWQSRTCPTHERTAALGETCVYLRSRYSIHALAIKKLGSVKHRFRS